MAFQIQAAVKGRGIHAAFRFGWDPVRREAGFGIGAISMQSTGQTGTQSSQPVHSDPITVCRYLGAPRMIDVRLRAGDGLGIGPAARVAALAALGLGKQGVDAFRQGIAGDLQPLR